MRGTLAPGLALVGLLAAAALLSLAWMPADPAAIDLARRFAPASTAHPLGTDQLGRDIAALLLAGARASLGVAAGGVMLALAAGVPVGLVAAAAPGWTDDLLMRGGDVLFAFPALLMAILLAALLGPGASTAVLAIALFNLPIFARVARGAARPLWLRDFVAAARLAGKGRSRIAVEHILPNLASVLAVQASLQLALALLMEAGLSYVGLGVQPPQASWGRMLAEAQTLGGLAPRLAVLPGMAIVVSALGFALVGDGLRDRLHIGEGGQ